MTITYPYANLIKTPGEAGAVITRINYYAGFGYPVTARDDGEDGTHGFIYTTSGASPSIASIAPDPAYEGGDYSGFREAEGEFWFAEGYSGWEQVWYDVVGINFFESSLLGLGAVVNCAKIQAWYSVGGGYLLNRVVIFDSAGVAHYSSEFGSGEGLYTAFGWDVMELKWNQFQWQVYESGGDYFLHVKWLTPLGATFYENTVQVTTGAPTNYLWEVFLSTKNHSGLIGSPHQFHITTYPPT